MLDCTKELETGCSMGEDSVMITHGILVDKDWNLLMRLLLNEPIIQPKKFHKVWRY